LLENTSLEKKWFTMANAVAYNILYWLKSFITQNPIKKRNNAHAKTCMKILGYTISCLQWQMH